MYGRRTRLSRRPRGRRSSRGRRSVRRIAWRTALATHEGTRISRICDRTLLPPTGNTNTLITRWDPVGLSDVVSLWGTQLKPLDVTENIIEKPQYSPYWNWRLPEFYAFRDGLHVRGRYQSAPRDYFIPVPGPTPFGPHNYLDLNDDGFDMAAHENSKCINISPGTMWNLFAPYSGIQRGEGRGMRSGTSIRSMKLSVGVTLTPAVIDVPVIDVPDGEYLLPATSISGSTYDQEARVQRFKDNFNSSAVPVNTSYIVPTWATVILFSYRKGARLLEAQDPTDSTTKAVDRPYVKANPLYWIRNRHRRMTVDEFGNRVFEPAERWAGHDQQLVDAGGTDYVLLGGPSEVAGPRNIIASADWTVPSLKQRRILYPSDVEYDKSVVKIHKIKTVRFNQPTTVVHDSESTLQPRWMTGRQFAPSVLADGSMRAPTGLATDAYPIATVGTSDPMSTDGYGNMATYTSQTNYPENPGIMALQKPPNVKSQNLRFQFNFNGERIEFDDTADDDRNVNPAFVVASTTQPTARQAAHWASSSTNATATILAQTVYTNSPTQYRLWAVGSTLDTSALLTWGADIVGGGAVTSNQMFSDGTTLASQFPIAQGQAAHTTQEVIPVKKWQHYGDNTPYKNLYMTVISPCYKWPVGASISDTSINTKRAFAIPNWGSAPVKVEVGTSFWFKK